MDHAAATYKYRDSHRFGRFELQPAERRLLADGQPVALGARAFDLLVVLVGRAGQLVAKNDLLTLVWPGLVVEENNLQVQISTLRKVLGQSAFATIPGRGYRFELPVEGADTAVPAAEPSGSPAAVLAAASEPARVRTNLPMQPLSLYGRARDLATIKVLLRQHAVVTVVGTGGILLGIRDVHPPAQRRHVERCVAGRDALAREGVRPHHADEALVEDVDAVVVEVRRQQEVTTT